MRSENLRNQIVEAGEVERLKDLLKKRLTESGWRDEMKAFCRDIVRQRGVENLTVDDLVKEMTPKGRELVPDSVKRELLQQIRSYLDRNNTVI